MTVRTQRAVICAPVMADFIYMPMAKTAYVSGKIYCFYPTTIHGLAGIVFTPVIRLSGLAFGGGGLFKISFTVNWKFKLGLDFPNMV